MPSLSEILKAQTLNETLEAQRLQQEAYKTKAPTAPPTRATGIPVQPPAPSAAPRPGVPQITDTPNSRIGPRVQSPGIPPRGYVPPQTTIHGGALPPPAPPPVAQPGVFSRALNGAQGIARNAASGAANQLGRAARALPARLGTLNQAISSNGMKLGKAAGMAAVIPAVGWQAYRAAEAGKNAYQQGSPGLATEAILRSALGASVAVPGLNMVTGPIVAGLSASDLSADDDSYVKPKGVGDYLNRAFPSNQKEYVRQILNRTKGAGLTDEAKAQANDVQRFRASGQSAFSPKAQRQFVADLTGPVDTVNQEVSGVSSRVAPTSTLSGPAGPISKGATRQAPSQVAQGQQPYTGPKFMDAPGPGGGTIYAPGYTPPFQDNSIREVVNGQPIKNSQPIQVLNGKAAYLEERQANGMYDKGDNPVGYIPGTSVVERRDLANQLAKYAPSSSSSSETVDPETGVVTNRQSSMQEGIPGGGVISQGAEAQATAEAAPGIAAYKAALLAQKDAQREAGLDRRAAANNASREKAAIQKIDQQSWEVKQPTDGTPSYKINRRNGTQELIDPVGALAPILKSKGLPSDAKSIQSFVSRYKKEGKTTWDAYQTIIGAAAKK